MQSPVAEFDEIETRNPSRCVSDKLDAGMGEWAYTARFSSV
jgi:hypothetical protein